MQDSSLEKQLQQLMSGLEFEPDAAVWENVEAEINPKKKKRVAAWWWLTGGILLLCLSGGILWYGKDTHKSAQPVASQQHTTEPAATLPPPQQASSTEAKGATAIQPQGDVQASTGAGIAETQATAPTDGESQVSALTSASAQAITAGSGGKRSAARSSVAGKINKPANASVFSSGTAGNDVTRQANSATQTANNTVAEYIHTLLPAMDMSVVLHNSKAAVAQAIDKNAFTPAAGVTPPVSVPQQQKSRWNAYPVVAIGGAANIGGVNTTYGYGSALSSGLYNLVAPFDRNDNVSYYPGSGTGSGSLTSYISKRNTYARPAFRLGLEVEYAMANRWRILTGLQYQHVSYKSVIVSQTQSNVNSSVGAFSRVTYDFAYVLQYVGIPLQGQYRFSDKLGVSAGVMNNIKLSGKQGGESINNAMRTYVPSALLSLDIMLPGRKEQVWKLSPYVQYGLKSNITGALQDKRMLQLGVQAVWQINNN